MAHTYFSGIPVYTGRNTAIAGKTTVITAGTPIPLGSIVCGDGVTIIASPSNTGIIYVYPVDGDKNDVVPLSAGDSNFWSVSYLDALLVDASLDSQSVYWQGAI